MNRNDFKFTPPPMQSWEKERNSRLKRRDGIRFAELAMYPGRHGRLEKSERGGVRNHCMRERGWRSQQN
jgi:hypothetical protein